MDNAEGVVNITPNITPESHSNKKKYFLIFGALLILGGLYCLFNLKNPNTPLQVLTEGLPAGSTVSLYENIPPGFPREVILENFPLEYSGVLATAEGKKQVSVSYYSDHVKRDVATLYRENLSAVGWNPTPKFASQDNTVMSATKGQESVLITISTVDNSKVLVTFQYEQ